MTMQGWLKTPVLNDKGENIWLSPREVYGAQIIQRQFNEAQKRFSNSLGYEVQITTVTAIAKKISEAKYYTVPFADYGAVVVGNGAFSTNIETFRSFDVADAFETGIMHDGGDSSRLAAADSAIDAVNIPVYNWGKTVTYSIFQLERASRYGNWDLVAAKEKARKRNWDLGLQRIFFLGADGLNGSTGSCKGFLNQSGVNTNTSIITKPISSMTPTELNTLQQNLVQAFRANCNYTVYPSNFTIPESDWNGLANQASADFPVLTKLALLENMFKITCQNPNFKILPVAYADAANHSGVAGIDGKQVYVLSNYDEESGRMDIPLDYTNTLANSLNNFSFQSVAYGEFTGYLAYRPLEHLYFVFDA